ncbi:uncharacterized protein LOC122080344 isoform X1 [Macadamia integrifolia]|uniref:uncharacterized protein LOC122080344 isoform X1 n=1 Tax=Macadamia integrifolia TaxID=60698 RepID=UPI001C4EAA08|nr:uncharacterized protein LOC122080344 isoform X1 [Macadamia integrifolia]XP_042503233.1 uncharacterized protein LOC122080344 isoform X1 [Macadamia integrifolia]
MATESKVVSEDAKIDLFEDDDEFEEFEIGEDVVNALKSMGKYFAWKMERAGSSSATSAPPSAPPSRSIDYSTAACHTLLDTIPDVPKELYMKALKRIWEDPKWRLAFIVSIPERRTWLLKMLES